MRDVAAAKRVVGLRVLDGKTSTEIYNFSNSHRSHKYAHHFCFDVHFTYKCKNTRVVAVQVEQSLAQIVDLTYKTRYVCLSVCLLPMAGRTAGPIKTKLGMGTHVDPGSFLGKVKVIWRHLANANKTPYRGPQGPRG